MKLIASIYDRCELWPFFVNYYINQGITEFHINLWQYSASLKRRLESRVSQKAEVKFYQCAEGKISSDGDARAHNIIREISVAPDEWFVIADLDEFHSFQRGSLEENVLGNCSSEIDYYRAEIIDRLSGDGLIPAEISHSLPLGVQFPIGCEITKNILKACPKKVIAMKGRIEIRPGHHRAKGTASSITGVTHHFKWFGRLMEIQLFRIQKSAFGHEACYSNESRRLIDYLTEKNGKIDICDPILRARSIVNDPTISLSEIEWK